MTTGAPIFLVSACSSGEEFVSAFRRYADRNGVMFIPIAEPLPAGRRGRFALALANGGVMIEGQAEVVSSAKSPSVLYGRVGMTVKFLSPDEPSQTMLAELERARTSLRPPAPSVAPRPADIPAEPRPTPPAPGGRIDATNALAECVLIGDVSSLSRDSDLSAQAIAAKAPSGTVPVVTRAKPLSGAVPAVKQPSGAVPVVPAVKQPSGAVPVVPAAKSAVPSPIAKQPSGAVPSPIAKQPSGAMPSPVAKQPSGAEPSPVARSVSGKLTMPMPTVDSGRTKAPSMPPPVPPIPAAPQVVGKATLALPALDRRPASPSAELTLPRTSTTQGVGAPKPLAIAPPPPVLEPGSRDEAVAAALKFAQAVEARGGGSQTIKGTAPAEMATLASPPPKPVFADLEVDEKTDLTTMPPSEAPASRKTSLGIAAVREPRDTIEQSAMPRDTIEQAAVSVRESRDTIQQLAIEEPTNPFDAELVPVEQVDPLAETQAAMRLSKLSPTVEEPSGDWSMSTENGALTITPRKPEPEPKKAPKGPPTGDWMIALDPSRPDGWSEPSKVEKRPPGELPGPPVSAVASDKPLDSDARAQPTIATDEPKIQIDPTLIEPLTPMPVEASDSVALAAASQPLLHVPVPRAATAAPAEPTVLSTETPSRKRLIVIVASAVAAIVLGVVLVIVLGGGDDAPAAPAHAAQPPTQPAPVAVPPDAAAQVAPVPTPQEPEQPTPTEPEPAVVVDTPKAEPTPEPVAATECTLTITSAPSAAEVTVNSESAGTTPAKVTVPCGALAKISVKKARFQAQTREVTPKPTTKPLRFTLAKTTFSVKVSSSPPGATVTLNGKNLGVTPAVVKLPAFEASTVKIAKDGYTAETQKVTPKNNASAIAVTLKKQAGKTVRRR